MLELLRKHQHGIMIVVAFIVIVAFAWFFNPYDTRQGSLNQALAFRIGGKGVTVKEVERQTRILQTANELGFNFTMQLLQPTFDVVDFTQNRYLLGREARKLGVDPSEAEVQKAIAEHPQFQRDAAFSEDAYLDAIKNTLEPNGLVAGDLRELMADKLRLEEVSKLLSTGVEIPPSVVDVEFQRERERITASVIDFKLADFEKDVEVTDEDLKAYYDEQTLRIPSAERQVEGQLDAAEQAALDLMMSPEKRKIEFVFFPEPAAPAASVPFPSTPTAPNLTPPPLLQPGTPASPQEEGGGLLTPPPLEPFEIPPSAEEDESEPPGQAPLEDAGELETEPLQAPPVDFDLEDLDLTPAEDLQSDFNAGALGDDAPPPPVTGLEGVPDLGDLDLGDLQLQAAPDVNAADAATASSDHAARVEEYLGVVDAFYTAVLDAEDPDALRSKAAAEGLELQTTELFAEDEPPTSPNVPAKLVTTTFKGSLENDLGILVPIEDLSPKGYYVARLVEVKKSSEYSFDEVKEKLREALTKERAIEAMEKAANEAREKLVAALGEGKSFAEATEDLGLAVRAISEFSLRDRPTGVENSAEILAAVPTTTTGSVSEMQRSGDDALLVFVSRRVAAPETKPENEQPSAVVGGPTDVDPAEEKKQLAESLEMQASSGMMRLWLADRREDARIVRDSNLVPPRIYFPRNLGGGLNF